MAIYSEPSNEIATSLTRFMLVWQHPNPAALTFHLFGSRRPGTYTGRFFDAGTNLFFAWPTPGKTNVVVTVTGTNLQSATLPSSPWLDLGANTWTATNPPGQTFFRSQIGPPTISTFHY